jgi:uncharacterized membrane protein
MSRITEYPLTRQGVRDLDNPIHRPMSRASAAHQNVGTGERALSTLGGTMLAGMGMFCGGLKGLVMIAAGGALVYRGVTGHCPGYQAAGINTSR